MKEKFRGWRTVFSFTFKQSTSGAGFKVITILVTLLILGGFIVGNIIAARPSKELEPSPIETVYVLDNSGLMLTDYQTFFTMMENKQYKHIEFKTMIDTKIEDAIKMASKTSVNSIAVMLDKKESGYQFEAFIPESANVSEGKANDLLNQMITAFNSNKLLQSGLSMEQLTVTFQPVVSTTSDIGESSSEAVMIIKMIAPMLFGFILYFMLLFYGQSVSKAVSTEKTSKLIENLLVSVHPYALISGKILAVTSMAIIQSGIWIASIFAGLYGGNAIAHQIYPEYQNTAISMINYLKDNICETAMSLPSIILAIIVLCVGFLFYSVLAGLAGSLVSKPEDAASTQGVFVFPVVISFLICYLAPLSSNDSLIKIARFVPLTAPFSVPVDLITGVMGLGAGIISMIILLIFSILVIILSARIYKGMILYNGQSISFKMIYNLIRAEK